MTRLVRIAALLSVWCAGVFASPPRSTMAFAHKSGLVIRAAALPGLQGAWRSQTRKLSNLQIAKGSISTLYQAKGRTEESLKAFAPRLAAKKFELDKCSSKSLYNLFAILKYLSSPNLLLPGL